MKQIYIITLSLCCLVARSQFTKIFTGTNTDLIDLSVIDKSIIINGQHNYLVNSSDECNNLLALYSPGSVDHTKNLYRLSKSALFLLSNKIGNRTILYKSIDMGANWITLLDTVGVSDASVAFFDQNEGIVTRHTHIIKTYDAGISWNYGSISISGTASLPVIRPLEVFENQVCMGLSNGIVYLSKDRGETWKSSYLEHAPSDFFFLNKDTVFAISVAGEMAKTNNGGATWKNYKLPIDSSRAIYFYNSIGYVLGSDTSGIGTIIKTDDLGKSWSTLKTGFKTCLLNMATLNDSIAILTGTDGVLLRWNYQNAIFTGLIKAQIDWTDVNIYPNPVKDYLNIDYEPSQTQIDKLFIINSLGQIIFEKSEPDTILSLESIASGLYYVRLEMKGEQKVFKLIKE